MKTKYEWMNDGKEFELPDFNQMNPQERLDILYLRVKAERKFEDIKPEGIRPKEEDLSQDWILYLNLMTAQHNLDIVVYALQTVDKSLTKEKVMDNLPEDKDIAGVMNMVFREGKNPKKKTEEPQKSKS